MNAGVIIERGASPWQIFQQGPEGTAPIRLEGTYHLVRLSQELPLAFSEVPPAKATVKARVALESTGESVIPWTECEIPSEGTWRVTFPAVPAGGLYRLETTMTYEGWDGLSCTRGDMVHHVGVGDVFVIAGQSNAAGRAKDPVADDPEPGVSVLRPSGRWDLASHPLGETTGAVYVGHYENHNPGHSPWLHFAKRLKRELGYPIGLVPCAYGGAPLRWWNPEENGALLRNMLEMLAFTSAFLRPYRRRARLNSDSGNPATGRTMMAQHASSKFCWNTTYSRLIMVITCRMICMNAGRPCRIMPTSLMTRDMSAPTCDSS